MPTNLLILPLLGGFLLVHFNHYFRFRSQQLEGYRLLFESAVAGAVLVTIARVVTYGLGFMMPPAWIKQWHDFFPIDFSGTGAGALVFGIILPLATNLCYGKQKGPGLGHSSPWQQLVALAAFCYQA